jgi:phosphatidylinositol-3-phosphatase
MFAAVAATALIASIAGLSGASAPSGASAGGFASPAARPSGPCSGATTPAISHVVVFVEENRSEPIVNKKSMPYLRALTRQCGLATNEHNLTHPSLGNYIGLTSGQVQGPAWSHDSFPAGSPQSQDNVFHQLDEAGGTWGVFAQSMPSNCYKTNAGPYYVRHTAAPYFDDINGRGGSTDTSCSTNDVPLGDPAAGTGNNLYNALYGIGGAQLPAFSLVIPDVCHDLHGQSSSCSGGELYGAADQFLATWVDLIVKSPGYASGTTAVLIMWDEGSGKDETEPQDCWAETITGKDPGGKPSCWVAAVVVSKGTPAKARSAVAFNHYDVLVAIETVLDLPVLPNDPGASGAANGTAAQFLSAFGLT